ncbi:MAG: transaldolase family protein [Christensenellales bacterium]|jgi:transaldolase
MKDHAYLRWMSENTPTKWCNDSAKMDELDAALASGAVGCTSNPPLTYETLTATPALYGDGLEAIRAVPPGDERAVACISVVVRHIAARLADIYESSRGEYGYIRAQVQPSLSGDADAMLKMGLLFASWAPNIKVKIPGTKAGIWVLEELAARGIPTNPTVCVSVSQMTAAAEAHERGVARARAAGIAPAPSTAAIVMGRLQDYLTTLNEERGAGLPVSDLEWAALAVAKRCCRLYEERGYQQIVMPAAFRCAMQVSELAGARAEMTIHPKIQDAVIEADAAGKLARGSNIGNAIDEDAVERVRRALPAYTLAYEENALSPDEFDRYGATQMTLRGFDVTGWQKLRTL